MLDEVTGLSVGELNAACEEQHRQQLCLPARPVLAAGGANTTLFLTHIQAVCGVWCWYMQNIFVASP